MRRFNQCSVFLATVMTSMGLAQSAMSQDAPRTPGKAAKPAAKASIGLAPLDGETLPTSDASGDEKSAEQKDREDDFARMMSGATLVGRFTILGKDESKMPAEEYTISRCEKLPEGDLYRFTARIKYGEVDTELPLDLPVLWAGDTPVITLTNMWIPGMGTFSSRVMFYKDSYAGTWQHDEVGGHMFGVIRRATNKEEGGADNATPAGKGEAPRSTNTVPAKPITTSSSGANS